MKAFATGRMAVLLALLCGAGTGATQERPLTGTAGQVPYATGGIGQEEREALEAMRDQYNLRLTFATRGSGALLANVALAITDGRRGPVMTLDECGPHVYVKLPPGSYTITAVVDGVEQRRRVTVGRPGGARELVLYWPGTETERA